MRNLIIGLLILTFFGCKKDDTDETTSIEKFKIFNSSNSPIQASNIDQITSLKIDEANNVWIGTKEHLSRLLKYSKSTNTWEVFGNESFGDSISAVFDIDFDQNNNVWVGTDDGVFKFDGIEWTSSLRTLIGSIPLRVKNIHVDKSNNIWCSIGGDLYKHKNNSWTNMTELDTLFPNQIQKIRSDDNGIVWIGCYNGLIKYDGNSFTKIEHEPDILGMNIYDLEAITPDNIWVGANRGLHQWDGSNWESIDNVAFENPHWDEHEWIVSAIAVNDEIKLFGTWNMGLAINHGDEYHFMRGNEFGIDTNRFQINELEYDLSKNIWMATRPGDVIVYNENGLK